MSKFEGRVADCSKPEGECWIWPGGKDKQGYGVVRGEADFGSTRVKDLSFEKHKGYIGTGMRVRQTCKNRMCWNPDHLVRDQIAAKHDAVHPSQNRAAKQESETAERIGGAVTHNSGAGAFEKGDIRIKGLVRVEAKTTKRASYSITRELIDKIEGHALQAGEIPAALIEVSNDDGARECYVVPKWAFEMLIEAVQRGAA